MKYASQIVMLAAAAAMVYGVYQLSAAWGWIVGGFCAYVFAYHLYQDAKSARAPAPDLRTADDLTPRRRA